MRPLRRGGRATLGARRSVHIILEVFEQRSLFGPPERVPIAYWWAHPSDRPLDRRGSRLQGVHPAVGGDDSLPVAPTPDGRPHESKRSNRIPGVTA